MDLAEGLILYIRDQVLAERQEELKTLERDIAKLEAIKAPFPRVHYDEAVKILNQRSADTPVRIAGSSGETEASAVGDKSVPAPFEWGGDFGAPDETYLSNHFGQPVFVHHFPAAIKGFYFEVDKDDPKYALGVDLLAPEGYGEIIGGGERAASLEYLEEQLKNHDLPKPDRGYKV
jgi:asparaginyl-tRNA synthetase